jgi:hypothetical protein
MFTVPIEKAAEISAFAELSAKQQTLFGPIRGGMRRDEAKPGKLCS